MAKCLCRKCSQTFVSVSGFDKHRVGDFGQPIYGMNSTGTVNKKDVRYSKHTRRCLTVEEMQAKGMSQNDKGWWITEALDSTKKNSLRGEDDKTEEEDELEEA